MDVTEPLPVVPRGRRGSGAGRTRRLLRAVGRIGIELVIVITGVYIAFVLAEYKEQRAEEARRRQIYEALVLEIKQVSTNAHRVAEMTQKAYSGYQEAIAGGQRPPLQPILDPTRMTPFMWNATLQSNALDLLDVPTVYRIANFYNELENGFKYIEQLHRLSESMLLPHLSDADATYYRPDGSLRPEYDWYLSSMNQLSQRAASIAGEADSLMSYLEARK